MLTFTFVLRPAPIPTLWIFWGRDVLDGMMIEPEAILGISHSSETSSSLATWIISGVGTPRLADVACVMDCLAPQV